jgi:hypothetical protein
LQHFIPTNSSLSSSSSNEGHNQAGGLELTKFLLPRAIDNDKDVGIKTPECLLEEILRLNEEEEEDKKAKVIEPEAPLAIENNNTKKDDMS